MALCRKDGCPYEGQRKFAGYCCFKCASTPPGEYTVHGSWCLGRNALAKDPGPHPTELHEKIKRLEKEIKETKEEMKEQQQNMQNGALYGMAAVTLIAVTYMMACKMKSK